MSIASPQQPRTIADMLVALGDIPPERILMNPPPGTATEQDAIECETRQNRLCELIDGILVEKTVGYCESIIAGAILALLRAFVIPRNLGCVSGSDGMMRLFPGLIRMPDVAFASWSRFPGGRLSAEPAPNITPDLAVEVLSVSNTDREMERKRREYFEAGVSLVWMIDPRKRSAVVYTSPDEYTEYGASDSLTGGEVLPGFTLSLNALFAELDRSADGVNP
ncbi:MAG: Uma2 family endonuclease [Candidatus Paceibacterota bacterium]